MLTEIPLPRHDKKRLEFSSSGESYMLTEIPLPRHDISEWNRDTCLQKYLSPDMIYSEWREIHAYRNTSSQT